jgi:hypothetical protein
VADVTEKDLVTATELMGRPPPDEPLTNLAWTQRRNAIAQALASARSEASGGWVPCEERMPAPNCYVMLLYCRTIQRIGLFDGAMWHADGETFPRLEVSHWMPLPKPPALPGAPHE